MNTSDPIRLLHPDAEFIVRVPFFRAPFLKSCVRDLHNKRNLKQSEWLTQAIIYRCHLEETESFKLLTLYTL